MNKDSRFQQNVSLSEVDSATSVTQPLPHKIAAQSASLVLEPQQRENISPSSPEFFPNFASASLVPEPQQRENISPSSPEFFPDFYKALNGKRNCGVVIGSVLGLLRFFPNFAKYRLPQIHSEYHDRLKLAERLKTRNDFMIACTKALNGKRNRGVVIGSVLGLLILLGGAAFAVRWFMMKSTPDVTLYTVGSQHITQGIGGGGVIFPRQQLNISYPVAERVISVFVKPGDQVSPDQSLIQLDASQLNVQIQQAANDMAAAQAYLNAVSVSGTAMNIAQAQQQYELAKNRYNTLVAQASSPLLQNGNLIAPMSGVVTAVNVSPGSVFAADVPLLTIMDESTVIVHAKIPLSDLGQVHLGQQATVTPSALPAINAQGTVSAIIPQADAQTDTFEVWVNIVNTNAMLLPGMSAFVHIQTASRALVVPRLAVLDVDSNASVFVIRNQHAHLRRVQVVGRTEKAVFIGGGLAAGDNVVLVGLDTLQDNQPVHVSRTEANTPPL